MRVCVIPSGSNANSTYVEVGKTKLLIDCGLSARQLELRMAHIGLEVQSLSAILVTHEHHDHTMGISVLSRRFKIPVFANHATAGFLKKGYALERFKTGEKFSLGAVSVHPFSIMHDAADPVGFSIMAEGLKYTQVTDLGCATELVRSALKESQTILIEANHDHKMLQECGYPWELKERITSAHGHLSNHEAGQLISEVMHTGLSQIMLGHISENSNTPQLAWQTVRGYLNSQAMPSLVCALRYEPTPIFEVGEKTVIERGAYDPTLYAS